MEFLPSFDVTILHIVTTYLRHPLRLANARHLSLRERLWVCALCCKLSQPHSLILFRHMQRDLDALPREDGVDGVAGEVRAVVFLREVGEEDVARFSL